MFGTPGGTKNPNFSTKMSAKTPVSTGFWVENGIIQYPVEEITIAGNLKDMLMNIAAVGNDVDYRGNIITGSILLPEMTIAGN